MGGLASILLELGLPILGKVLRAKGGAAGGAIADVADAAIRKAAERLGVEPTEEAIAESYKNNPAETSEVLLGIEAELAPIYLAGVEGQFALLQAETKEGVLQSAWRWGWMYLLAFFWVWRIIVLPIVNRLLGDPAIEAIDLAVLLTLTSWFIALYMGGHTIKDLGKNIADGIARWKKAGG